jgi:hypothetical protein
MNFLQKSQEIKKKFINNSNFLILSNSKAKYTTSSTINTIEDQRIIYLEKGDLPTDFSVIEESFNNPTESINDSINYLSSLLQRNQRPTENPNQRPPTEEPVQRPSEKPNQRPPTENPVQRPPTEETIQRPTENPVQRPPTEETIQRPPTEETIQRPPTEEPVQRPPVAIPPITAYISIYLINDSDAINPFFQYYFIWDEEAKTANFPKKIINLQLPSSLNSNNENTYIQTQIINECIEYILEVFDLYEEFNSSIFDEMFKGFIWNSKLNTVHLFFNVSKKLKNPNTRINDSIEPSPMFKWAILDEIINKQYIVNKSIPIFSEIINLFKENTFLNTIYISAPNNNLKKIPLEYPLSLYICKNRTIPNQNETTTLSVVWENVYNDNNDIIENTINFQPLGDYYYFSSIPINSNSSDTVTSLWNKDNIKKYAVFLNINNGKYSSEESYIVKDINTITEEQWDNYTKKINQTDVSTIWFKENGLQLWAIKYPTQFCSII